MSSQCTKYALDIKTIFPGKNQPTHPSLHVFDMPWNGFLYWMAYTPYPYMDGSQENPCIAVSNDLVNWHSPQGLHNPIATCYDENCDELKDPELLYNIDNNQLELWYLGRINSSLELGGPLYVFRKTTRDGINWSDREIVFRYDEYKLVSETVIFEKGIYRFWGFRSDSVDNGLYYMESKDNCKTWTPLTRVAINTTKYRMWHGCVSMIDNQTYCIWVGYSKDKIGRTKTFQELIFSKCFDGINWSEPRVFMTNNVGWQSFYRPYLVQYKRLLCCYYGLIKLDGSWKIGLSTGTSIDSLIPNYVKTDYTPKELYVGTPIDRWYYVIKNEGFSRLAFIVFLLYPVFLFVPCFNHILSFILTALISIAAHLFRKKQHIILKTITTGFVIIAIINSLIMIIKDIVYACL